MQSIEEILNESAKLISQREFSKVLPLLEKANTFEPDNKEVLRNLGLCYVNLEEFSQGKNVFEKLVKLDENDANAWFYLGNCQEKTSEEESAIKSYSRVIKLRNEFWECHKNLCVLLLKQGLYEQVISIIEKILQTKQDDYQFEYFISTAYMALGKQEDAIAHLKKALELNPEHVQLLNNLGSCCMAQGQWDEAKIAYEKAYSLNPQNATTNYNLGTLYQLKNDYQSALRYFNDSYRIEPSVMTLSTLAYCAIQTEKYDLGATLYRNLAALHPEKQIFQKNLMNCLVKLGEISQALKIAQQLTSLNPKSFDLTKKLAQLYRLNNQPYQALEILNALIKRGRIDKDVYHEHALCSVRIDEYETAKNSFRKVIQLEPDNAMAHKDLALLYINMNLADWAQDEIQTALSLDGENPDILMGYATYLYKSQEFEKANEYYEKAIEKCPNESEYHLCYGINLSAQNKNEESRKKVQKALELDPKSTDAKYYLAKSCFVDKKYKQAKEILLDIMEAPDNIETANLLALSYMELKEWFEAKVLLVKLVEKFPKNHLTYAKIAKCALKLKELDEAKDYARKALEIFSDFEDAIKILKKIETEEENGTQQ